MSTLNEAVRHAAEAHLKALEAQQALSAVRAMRHRAEREIATYDRRGAAVPRTVRVADKLVTVYAASDHYEYIVSEAVE